MKNLLLIFIVFAFLGCNYNAKDKNKTNVFPVISTLSSVSCEWYENPKLNEKAGIKKMGTIHLSFKLSNPNDFPVYIPIHNYKDSMYKSNIETYLKGKRLTTENKVLRVLYHEGIQFVDIKIYDINEYNHYKDFEDAKKIISDLEFKYIKDESDSIYRKMKVGDMRFDIDDYLRVIYKLPKDEVDKRIKEVYTYTYDHAGRAMKTTHSVNGSTEVTLADNSYDTLGRLSNTGRGGNGMLSMAYTYNVRSWMTGLSGSLFSESLYYTDNPYNTGNRHYGGNISAMGWKAGQTQRAYDLSYDKLSRLIMANYYETASTSQNFSTQYTYDSMGNILTLKRNGLQDGGTYGLVDNLTYTYNGNHLSISHFFLKKIGVFYHSPTQYGILH